MSEMNKNKKCCLNCAYLRMVEHYLMSSEGRLLLTWERRKQFYKDRSNLNLKCPKHPRVSCSRSQFANITILQNKNKQYEITQDSFNFIQTNSCPLFYKHQDCFYKLNHETIAKRQTMEIELENAVTAKKALEISRKSFWFTIIVLIISSLGASLAILDFFGDKEWQDNQISALRETNTLLKQQIELKLAEKTNTANQTTYGSSPWQEYIKSDIDIAINNLGE
ncbi:MAG: hypothetical protein ACIAQZ_01590 [Sedimentisphaeraceae bacterium JB056]